MIIFHATLNTLSCVTLMAVYFPFFLPSFSLSLRAVDYENAIANVFARLIAGRNKDYVDEG